MYFCSILVVVKIFLGVGCFFVFIIFLNLSCKELLEESKLLYVIYCGRNKL